MEWVKVSYPEIRRVFVEGQDLGATNEVLPLGEDGTYNFDLGTPVDYEPARIQRAVSGTSEQAPLEIRFEQKSSVPSERRAEYRIDVSIPGVINDVESIESKDCVVYDATKSGCRVMVDNGFEISDEIILFLKTFGRKIPGRVVWRREHFIGVQFNWAAKS